jgi:hypothetical protein
MSVNPTLTQMVAQTRMTDMQRAAARASDGTRLRSSRSAVGTLPLPSQTGESCPTAARRSIGWFLVGVGLRLAVPRTRPASAR